MRTITTVLHAQGTILSAASTQQADEVAHSCNTREAEAGPSVCRLPGVYRSLKNTMATTTKSNFTLRTKAANRLTSSPEVFLGFLEDSTNEAQQAWALTKAKALVQQGHAVEPTSTQASCT